jgi:hypothetical protein
MVDPARGTAVGASAAADRAGDAELSTEHGILCNPLSPGLQIWVLYAQAARLEENQVMIAETLIAVVFVFVAPPIALAAGADPQRPTPVPMQGAGCPAGYSASAGACVPLSGTKGRAFPAAGPGCPVGYSMRNGLCVETSPK